MKKRPKTHVIKPLDDEFSYIQRYHKNLFSTLIKSAAEKIIASSQDIIDAVDELK